MTLFVDAMNVIGSRPDGWWRDREGAMRRLVSEIQGWASTRTQPRPMSAGTIALKAPAGNHRSRSAPVTPATTAMAQPRRRIK